MPHVSIKYFPRHFTDDQKTRLAEEITTLVSENFEIYRDAVSVSLEPVAPEQWDERVVVPELTDRADLLIKAPRYRQN
ncbi:tautomerase family protein [Streptomyces sp. NPDC059402]|jgi:4-oxalocrotonate tautomerase|uniref:tautomerase family protein n=1 Tax=unclassified Streptomyces TaxID=2593676 RepID=UPI0036A3045C